MFVIRYPIQIKWMFLFDFVPFVEHWVLLNFPQMKKKTLSPTKWCFLCQQAKQLYMLFCHSDTQTQIHRNTKNILADTHRIHIHYIDVVKYHAHPVYSFKSILTCHLARCYEFILWFTVMLWIISISIVLYFLLTNVIFFPLDFRIPKYCNISTFLGDHVERITKPFQSNTPFLPGPSKWLNFERYLSYIFMLLYHIYS